ncbi:hypothetical protein RBG61_06415 [Paludicola sp. MB14-C6]|uniref:hypothetical protein n=1 Tax=Paludihabitans sp. MB14-C6 TaxID=3070656 RepID=UPI0027DB0ADE|nr:hypothetical protein [Paludicola sp. MB14-C6]WMJ24294.1 hypothetical protein RBG61_06415 [Paludicola sp. MB14-C6]
MPEATNYYTPTEDDIAYVDEMATFYNIPREEALERFLSGNIEGNELTEDEIAELEEQ